jgi:hypothetical protein
MGTDQKYLIYIRGDTLQEITEESAHLLYFFLNRLLQEHRRQAREMATETWPRDRHFESFAIQILALLQQYRNVYAEYAARSPAEE